METLEQLRRQLDAVEDLGTLVRTMKALAQVNIHQSEHAVRAVQMYLRTVQLGLHALLAPEDLRAAAPHLPADASQGVVVFGSDHGLCGRFNDDAADHAVARIALARQDGAPVRLAVVGARVAACLEQQGERAESLIAVPGSAPNAAATVQCLLTLVDGWRSEGVDRVRLIHNRGVSTTRYQPVTQEMLPADLRRVAKLDESWPSRGRPMHTMPRASLLAAVVRQYLFVMLFRACAESLAAEHGARLAAMQAAEKALGERLGDLAKDYRRKRQERITAELLDVVGGFEVLTGGASESGREAA
ncbi:MAG: F0F1 ATP synthase subunit gamma [Burkholderiales bacterium]|nr:MAG: F0F1 ATP synthase subunit gamma [Burkholderiales bacterium]